MDYSKNIRLNKWVEEMVDLCTPKDVYWCNGSKEEYDFFMEKMVRSGAALKLSRDDCFHFCSDPSDVARVEDRTFISYSERDKAGPTNNWMHPDKLKKIMLKLYRGSMKGRSMYVIPFSMGPVGGPISKIGIEITDSPYVVCNMHIMTRVGSEILNVLGEEGEYIPCMHSVGAPLNAKEEDSTWPCAPIEKKYISHFPDENLIWSYGSGYGGNALLGKKCLALRIASVMAKREGWMAEHMLILRLTDPKGRQFHIAGAFPSACGKTNLAMIQPTLPGWSAECIGDDIAWLKIASDGKLYAINPEAGFFGVAPGTSSKTNPMAMETIKKGCIFTNCAVTDENDVWWEGKDGFIPDHLIDWKGKDWNPSKNHDAAHPNARFTAPAANCPMISVDWEKPEGVPIDIFIFGGRRAGTVPLVYESFGWDHGVFLGATAASETTAANIGSVGNLRRDPFAMLPFCGYNMGDYFQHWLDIGDRLGSKAPKIFYVNWFRKNLNGDFIWPGFGENSRILKWMCERTLDEVGSLTSPIGRLPLLDELDLNDLTLPKETLKSILTVNSEEWKNEIPDIEKYFAKFEKNLPERLTTQLKELKNRLEK